MPKPTFHNLSAEKRERLVAAAIAEFAAHPFREASLDRVAAAAGVSKGSLYQYFEDKADLHRFVVLDELGARRTTQAPSLEGGFFDRLEAMFFSGLAEMRRDPKLAALGARLVRDTSQPEVRALTKASHERAVAWFRSELAAAKERGEIREDLDLDVAARLVAHVAGPALLDVLESRLGTELAELTARRAAVDAKKLEAGVRAVMDVLRHGIASTKEGRRKKP